MAVFTITVNESVNLPPNQVGDYYIFSQYEQSDIIFEESNFTTDTNPQYQDPEGDAIKSIKIVKLPLTGVLYYDNVEVILDQEILISNIGLLKYTHDTLNEAKKFNTFEFRASDVGSGLFNTGKAGTIQITVEEKLNLPPQTVGNRDFEILNNEVYIFTVEDFTTLTTPEYSDPEGDSASLLKITSLPTVGTLKLGSDDIIINQIIQFSEIETGDFTYTPIVDDPYIMTFNFEIADSGSGIFTAQ